MDVFFEEAIAAVTAARGKPGHGSNRSTPWAMPPMVKKTNRGEK
jgi:hypothetical protein